MAAAHIVKSPGNLVGDLFNRQAFDGLTRPRLQFRLERTQQGFDRIEVNRGRDSVQSRAKLVENWVEFARAGARIDEAVEFAADFDKYRLKGLRVGVGAAGGGELGVEFVQQPFDRAGVDRCGWKRLKGLSDAIDPPGQVVERARIDRHGSARPSNFLVEPRRDLLQAPLNRRERGRGGRALDLLTGSREQRGQLGGLGMGSRTHTKPLDAVSQLADLALQPLKRRRSQHG